MSDENGGNSDGGSAIDGTAGTAGKLYPFPTATTSKKRPVKGSRLTKTAAGLALIVGTGAGVASLSGADGTGPVQPGRSDVSASQVVEISKPPQALRLVRGPAFDVGHNEHASSSLHPADGQGPDTPGAGPPDGPPPDAA